MCAANQVNWKIQLKYYQICSLILVVIYRMPPAGEDHGPALAHDAGADNRDLLLSTVLKKLCSVIDAGEK